MVRSLKKYIFLLLFIAVATNLHAYSPKATKLYNQANKNLQSKKTKSAISNLKRAIKIEPKFYEAYFLLGNIYYIKGNLDSAVSNYKQVLTLNENHVLANRYLGSLYLTIGNIEPSLKYLEMAYKLQPSNKDIVTEYSTALFHSGDNKKAIAVLQKNYSGDHYGINYLLSKVYSSEENSAKSTYYLEIAYKNNPTEAVSKELSSRYLSKKQYKNALRILMPMAKKQDIHYEQIVSILLMQGKTKDADDFLAKSRKMISKDVFHKLSGDIHYANKLYFNALNEYLKVKNKNSFFDLNEKLGELFLRKKKFSSARMYYQKIVKTEENRFDIQNKIVFCLYSEKKYDKALELANKTLPENQNDIILLNQIGMIHLKQNKLPLSKHYFKKSVSIKHEQSSPHYHLGIIHYRMKQYDLSITNFKTSIKYDPQIPSAYIYMGNAYEIMNQYDLAFQNFKKALEIDENNPIALLNLGKAYYNKSNIPESLKYLLKYLSIKSKDTETLLTVSKIYQSQKQYDQAIAYINKAIKIKGRTPLYALGLANLYLEKNDNQTAIETIKKLLKTYPKNIDAHSKLANIYKSNSDIPHALHHYRQIIMIDSTHIEARKSLISLYLSQPNYKKATYHIDRLTQISPSEPIIPWAQGVINFSKYRYDTALEQFLKTSFSPETTPIYLGKIYFSKNNYDEAINRFRSISDLNPAYFEVQNCIFLTHFLKEDYDSANTLKNSITSNTEKKYAESFYVAAELEFRANNVQKALEYSNLALTTKSSLKLHPFSNIYRNNLFLLLGKLNKSIKEYDKAAKYLNRITNKFTKDNFIEIKLLLADIYFHSDKRKQALKEWKKILKIDKKNPIVFLGLAKLFHLQKNYNKAIMFAKKVLDLPTTTKHKEEASIMLGDLYTLLSKRDESINAFKEALKLNPQSIEIHLKLSGIQYINNEFNEAIFTLENAKKIDSKNLEVLYLLGKSHNKLKNYKLAQEYFEQIIDLDSKNLKVYITLIESLIENNSTDLAIKYIDHSLSIARGSEENKKHERTLLKLKNSIR